MKTRRLSIVSPDCLYNTAMRSTFYLLLLLVVIFYNGLTAQTPRTDPVIEIPFEFSHNQIVISVKVDGKGPFNMLLDTGTDPSAIDIAAAKDIGLKLGSTAHQS